MGTDLQTTRTYDIADMIASSQQQAQTAPPTTSPYYLGTPDTGIVNCSANLTPAIKYEYLDGSPVDYYAAYGSLWYGQTFTPSVTHTIFAVKILISKWNPPGIITLSIRATSAGLPTGADLCIATTDGNTLSGNEWRIFYLVSPIRLSAGTQYALVVRVPTGSWSYWVAWNYTGNSYANGEVVSSTDSGATWSGDPSHDFYFEEWGLP
jgi:hypothetical protein